jgi:Cell division protein CrgA
VSKLKARLEFSDPTRGPLLTKRFVIALVLMVLGIAWIAYYYLAVHVDPSDLTSSGKPPEPGGPQFMQDLGDWNYLIGFGLFFLGLMVSAHPSTPLGRGRGVVVGMLGCFLLGLAWICVYYVFSNDLSKVPLMDDLGQYNLMVGIAFMAVGFTFATRWE